MILRVLILLDRMFTL